MHGSVCAENVMTEGDAAQPDFQLGGLEWSLAIVNEGPDGTHATISERASVLRPPTYSFAEDWRCLGLMIFELLGLTVRDFPHVSKPKAGELVAAEEAGRLRNSIEADAVMAVLRHVRAAEGTRPTLAILSPYKAQVEYLQSRLTYRLTRDLKHLDAFAPVRSDGAFVGTIDSFQGNEAVFPKLTPRKVTFVVDFATGDFFTISQVRRSTRSKLETESEAGREPERGGPDRVTLVVGAAHEGLMRRAAETAKRRLTVGCHRLGSTARPGATLQGEAAAERAVDVAVLYTFPAGPLKKRHARILVEEAAANGVRLAPVGKTHLHGKFLVWDDDDVVVTSLNWTSSAVDHDAPWNDVGVHISSLGLADSVYRRLAAIYPGSLTRPASASGSDEA